MRSTAIVSTALTWLLAFLFCDASHAQSSNFQEAARAFNALPKSQKFDLQAYLLVSGYSDLVANEQPSRRLIENIKAFQAQNNFVANGILDSSQWVRLQSLAEPLLSAWVMQEVRHPRISIPIWIPRGVLSTLDRKDAPEIYSYQGTGMIVNVKHYDGVAISMAYGVTMQAHREKARPLKYSILKDDFFVIALQEDGIESYERIQAVGNGIVGFQMLWKPDVHPEGNRLSSLMSDLLRSATTLKMERAPPKPLATGALRTLPPLREERREAAAAPVATQKPQSPERTKSDTSSGTGFFVSAAGHILTNEHVIEGCRTFSVTDGEGRVNQARLIGDDPTNDLALLQVSVQPLAVASLRMGARVGESAYAFGFPLAGLLSSRGNFTTGSITATAGLLDDTRMYQISTPIQQGNSGGPLLDQSGNVIGVIVSKLDAIKFASVLKDIPQNINFAIKSNVAVGFLEAKGVDIKVAPLATVGSPADVADQAKKFSVHVKCNR